MELNDILIYTGLGLFGFCMLALIFRWVLQLDGLYNRQQIQLRLLIELCREKGIDEDKIERAILDPWTYTKKDTKAPK